MLERLTILGSGGWVPAHGRHTACALLRDGAHAILIDAGSGVGRLVEQPELLGGVERLDILLTHFHFDHIAGLAYLPALELCPQSTIWGPGQALYGTSTQRLLGQVTNEPFHPVPLDRQDIEVRDLPAGELDLAGVTLRTCWQERHSAPTLALRFGDLLAWMTDTAYDPASAPFAAGCRMLAHEAWFTSDRPRNPAIHTSAAEAGQVARDAGCERLLLIHLPPFEASAEALLGEARQTFERTALAEDLGLLELSGG